MFRTDGGSRLGALRPGHDDEVVELSEPAGMLGLIDAGDEGLARVRSALSSSRSRTPPSSAAAELSRPESWATASASARMTSRACSRVSANAFGFGTEVRRRFEVAIECGRSYHFWTMPSRS